MIGSPLSFSEVTVNRVAHDTAHIGTIKLDDQNLTFLDENGSQYSVAIGAIKKVSTDGMRTARVICSGSPHLQIWMYDFYAYTNGQQFGVEKDEAIRAQTKQLLDFFRDHGIKIKLLSKRDVIFSLVALVVMVTVFVIAISLYLPIGIIIGLAIIGTMFVKKQNTKKEIAHLEIQRLK